MRRELGPSSRWATFAVAAAATATIGVPVRKSLLSSGMLDVPNYRSSHTAPIPRGAGIAVLLGAGSAVLVTGRRPSLKCAVSVLSLAGLGLADDISGHVPAQVRLGIQVVLGAGALGQGGWDRAIAGVVTAGVVNVVNFMDGINGITGMTAVVWGLNAMLMEDEGGSDLGTLGALTAGAGLGFLPHNIPSARLFLGDVGSYAVGAAMATGILSQSSLARRYQVAAPLLLCGVDATQALVCRARAGAKLTDAHREHVYQRLVDRGRSHVAVALLHAALAGTVAAAARRPWSVATSLTLSVVIAYLTSAEREASG